MRLLTFTISCLCSLGVSYAGTMGPVELTPWTGFYLGANAGGWWSQNNSIDIDGTPDFVDTPFNSTFPDIISNSLAAVGTNNLSIDPHGFIGGGQVGYNHQMHKLVAGLEADFDGLQQSNNTATRNFNVLVPSPGTVGIPTNYEGTITVTESINFLGTVRGRLGWLFTPTFLLYGTGGFAYGNVSLNTMLKAQNSFGEPWFSPIHGQNKVHQTQTGWTAGVGGEWMFHPKWSVRAEYIYYNLGTVTNNMRLEQRAYIPDPFSGVVGAAHVESSAPISIGTARLGVNYHFS